MIKATKKYQHDLVPDNLLSGWLKECEMLIDAKQRADVNPRMIKDIIMELKHFSVCRADGKI